MAAGVEAIGMMTGIGKEAWEPGVVLEGCLEAVELLSRLRSQKREVENPNHAQRSATHQLHVAGPQSPKWLTLASSPLVSVLPECLQVTSHSDTESCSQADRAETWHGA